MIIHITKHIKTDNFTLFQSFYTKNDEIASGNMARKHAGEFRAYLDARTEIDE